MKRLRRVWDDVQFLELMDRGEQQLAKVLSLVLVVVMVAATLQLIWQVGWALTTPSTPWMSSRLIQVLGDLLTLMIALEVLQNITSYLRSHVVQIELVLLTAMTAVARKVIVMPQGNDKPELLAGLGLAVLALGGAFWLVRTVNLRQPAARTGLAKRSPEPDRLTPPDGADRR